MPTVSARGSGTPVTNGTTWATVTSAVDGAAGTNPATYATWTNAVSGATGYIEISGYNFSSLIGAGDTINSVTVSVRNLVNNTGRITTLQYRPYDGVSPLGAAAATATLNTVAHNDSSVFAVTLAQLRSANFKIRVNAQHAANTQSLVLSVDYADVTVDYTVPTVVWTGGSTGTLGVAGTSGSFIGHPPPQTWASTSVSTIGVLAFSGEFIEIITGGRTLESDLTRRLEDSVYRLTEELGSFPQTWSGSTGTIGLAGTSGSFTAGPVSWSSGTATIGVAGTSGSFTPGGINWGGTSVDVWEPFNNFTDNGWVVSGSPSIVAGRTGTAAQVSGTANRVHYNIGVATQSDTITIGFAWRRIDSSISQRDILQLYMDDGIVQANKLTYNPSSTTLTFTRAAIDLVSNTTIIFSQNIWYYIELQCVLSDIAGRVIVRVNGVEVINSTALDTRAGGTVVAYDQIRLTSALSATTSQYDDLYLTMGSGGTFAGDITAQPVAGDVATLGIAATSGSFITAGGPQSWPGGSIATIGVVGISGAFVIAAPATGTRYIESNILRITEGNIGRNLEGIDVLTVIGLYNGQDVYELMYGPEPVDEWILV